MSDPVPSDSAADAAFRELEVLVRHLGEEVAMFRKRAQQAEARLKALGASPAGEASAEERVAALETENAALRARLDEVAAQTEAALDRVTFLRQQHALGGESA